jgi:glutaconate CoA-transferase subunit A
VADQGGKSREMRKKKEMSYKQFTLEFKHLVKQGSSICIGGLSHQNRPVALVRELIRQNIGDLVVYSSPVAGYDVDLLISSGLVKETYIAAVTFESSLAPAFRNAVETRKIKAHMVDVLTIMGGLMAAAEGIPFHPVDAWNGTDIVKHNPLIKKIKSPFEENKELYAVKPIKPDVVLLHAQESDRYGNIRYLSSHPFGDTIMARAGKKVIVSVDRIVDSVGYSHARDTDIPCSYVDCVVEIPFGAHPSGSSPFYQVDEEFMSEYISIADLCRKNKNWVYMENYISDYVKLPGDSIDYMEKAGGLRKVFNLKEGTRGGRENEILV